MVKTAISTAKSRTIAPPCRSTARSTISDAGKGGAQRTPTRGAGVAKPVADPPLFAPGPPLGSSRLPFHPRREPNEGARWRGLGAEK